MSKFYWISLAGSLILSALVFQANLSTAAESEPQQTTTTESENQAAPREQNAPELEEPPELPAPEKAHRLSKSHRVWIDAKQKLVYVDGYVSLDEGLLEMFACTSGTKEHESVVAVYSSAQVVHAALLAVGAKPGHPVKWDPEFSPPTGTEIEIEVRWRDEANRWKKLPAQQWITDVKTDKPMKHNWVFAGSGFWKDEQTGQEYYLAEAGDLICVTNFSSATLDIPVESSQANNGLLFEANTDKVPPIGTPVRLVLKPKFPKQAKPK